MAAAASTGFSSGPPFGLMASRYCSLRQVTTRRSPGLSASLIRSIAETRTCSGISSSPSRTGRISPDLSSASARVRSVMPSGGGLARPGWSIRSWAHSQSRRVCSVGFQEAMEARIGTGSPSLRSLSRPCTSRTISIVLPAPGSPSTTSRPVGTRSSTSTRSSPCPAKPSGPSAQVPGSRGVGHLTPVVARLISEPHSTVRSGSAAAQETGSG
jgi:hypothetical protein